MNSPALNSKKSSIAFSLLDQRIQRWIWELGWTELRDIQEFAIPAILREQDTIIAAATASGKTEAAFFPVLTRLISKKEDKATVLYISPLKALINDQWDRLEQLCERLDIIVTPWHGDISTTKKKRFLGNPRGCVLITPESLEALLMNYGHQIPSVFSGLVYCVIDEVHAFMGTERGKQLQSLLHRLEIAINKKIPRIGLSATIGDLEMAAYYLRQENPQGVQIIESEETGQELKVVLYGFKTEKPIDDFYSEQVSISCDWVAEKLYPALRGSNNLVFPNSRANVEIFSDKLRNMCEKAGVPNEFWPHHGSLSKEIREETERALKKRENPATAICTNTLELGIDIGSIKSVAQVGAPPSVASLRQRIGRSGRKKGESAILRSFGIESALDHQSKMSDLLREELVQSIAIIQLLTEKWCEPINAQGLHLSTLIQQLLSGIVQYGGLSAGNAWGILCETGPFSGITKTDFVVLLRELGTQEIISQDHTGLLLLGTLGEKIVNHYTFYASFTSDEEYRVICQGKTLGTLPLSKAVIIGSYIIFAGKRWRVEAVDEKQKAIIVFPGGGGKVPRFFGGGSRVHNKIREKMREVLASQDLISFLDEKAIELIDEARGYYQQIGLDSKQIIENGKNVLVFTWMGDDVQDTLVLMFNKQGHRATNEGIYVSVEAESVNMVQDMLKDILKDKTISAETLAQFVKNKQKEKWDWLLPEALLNKNYASLYLDLESTNSVIKKLL